MFLASVDEAQLTSLRRGIGNQRTNGRTKRGHHKDGLFVGEIGGGIVETDREGFWAIADSQSKIVLDEGGGFKTSFRIK